VIQTTEFCETEVKSMNDVQELDTIAEQRMDDPFVVGRIVSRLRKNGAVSQRSKDRRSFEIFWRDTGAYWRCTILLAQDSDDALTQIDLHGDGTVRVESHEPCSVTVDPSEDLLVISRFTKRSER